MMASRDPVQAMQRVKVGMIGLVAVVLLIAFASAILGSAARDRPIVDAGPANVVADNAAADNEAALDEPLAELGVAPSTANTTDRVN